MACGFSSLSSRLLLSLCGVLVLPLPNLGFSPFVAFGVLLDVSFWLLQPRIFFSPVTSQLRTKALIVEGLL